MGIAVDYTTYIAKGKVEEDKFQNVETLTDKFFEDYFLEATQAFVEKVSRGTHKSNSVKLISKTIQLSPQQKMQYYPAGKGHLTIFILLGQPESLDEDVRQNQICIISGIESFNQIKSDKMFDQLEVFDCFLVSKGSYLVVSPLKKDINILQLDFYLELESNEA